MRQRLLVIGIACSTFLHAGCSEVQPTADESSGAPAVASQSVIAAASDGVAESAHAKTMLKQLRRRHPNAAPAPGLAAANAGDLGSVLDRPGVVLRQEGDAVVPQVQDTLGRDLDLRVPLRADAPLRLSSRESGVSIEAQLVGAQHVAGEIADGYVVYPGAGPGHSTLLHRVSEEGSEDFLALDAAPPGNEVVYELKLSEQTASLRLIEDTLEALDGDGNPRLRVSQPYIVSADGTRVPANLSVEGCTVDQDPAPPWDRALPAPGARNCMLHVSWDGDAVQYPALFDPSWSSTASMSVARAFFTSTVLDNGRVFVVAGYNNGTPLTSAEIYNPTTRTWAATGGLATPRYYHAAAKLTNGRVLVTGGINNSGAVGTTGIYNPTTGAFATGGALRTPRYQMTLTVLSSGSVLMAGGAGSAGTLSSCELATSTGSSWSATGSLAAPLSNHSAVRISTGRVLVTSATAPSAQLYNASTGTWSSTGALAVPRNCKLATMSDNKVLCAGGAAGEVEIYDPATAAWTRTGSLIYARNAHTIDRLSDGRIVVIGGGPNPGYPAGESVETFNPTYGTWSPGPKLGTSRWGHVSALLSNGRILVAGGSPAAFQSTATAEEYISTTTATSAAEYRFTASTDPDILGDRATEIWASLHRPSTLASGTRYPLVLFLHGNHATCGTGPAPRNDDNCQYTSSGTCPSGYSVVNNHRGYDYIANELASRGYIVVSINANRGITCGGGPAGDGFLIRARANLVLKHLQLLSSWNRGAATTPASLGVNLTGKLDLTQVGLMGHSRGGEGVRMAYNTYRDAGSPWPGRIVDPVNFRGIFEIGPVEGQAPSVQNAIGTNRVVLLPMCDGDVTNLGGVFAHDRAMNLLNSTTNPTPGFSSTFTVWGANHNYYNTQWQVSDWSPWGIPQSTACVGHRRLFGDSNPNSGVSGSAEQLQTGFASMIAFFVGNVGSAASTGYNRFFDPLYSTIAGTRIDRGYTPAWRSEYYFPLEEFNQATGTSSWGQPNAASGITISHGAVANHDPGAQRGATIGWASASTSNFFQSNWAASGSGFNLSGFEYLDLRLARVQDASNPAGPTSIAVNLVKPDGTLSNVRVITGSERIDGPVGSAAALHPIMQTVRLPLADFGIPTNSVRGVRLTFSQTASGRIVVANIRVSRAVPTGPLPSAAAFSATSLVAPTAPEGANLSLTGAGRPSAVASAEVALPAPIAVAAISAGNTVTSLRAASDDANTIEVELGSTTAFLPLDQGLVLQIGSVQSELMRYPTGDLTSVVFKVPRAALEALAGGEAISVRYGRQPGGRSWDFGRFDKSRLGR